MQEQSAMPDSSLGRERIGAARERLAARGVHIVFRTAEQCKPDNLARDRLSFQTVIDWPNPDLEFAIRGRDINEDRLSRFADYRFVFLPIPMTQIRAWPRAGGLPADWTDQHSIGDLGKMLRDPGISVPDNAVRLRSILDFSRDTRNLDQLRLIPSIALPEFHGQRSKMETVPWTLDDGSHRALVLAMNGDTHLWCLAGFRHQQQSVVAASDQTLDYLAGANPDDREAISSFLRRPDGQRRLSTSSTLQDCSAVALGHLPDLPTHATTMQAALMQRVELRRAHAATARASRLFCPTDNHGRILASLVATAEFVRTKGARAFLVDPDDDAVDSTESPTRSAQDAAFTSAGKIAHAALDVGGADVQGSSGATLNTYPAVLDFVRQLAEDRQPHNGDNVQAIVDGAPALAALNRATDQKGAAVWLGRQLARASIVAADAAEILHNWPLVQYHSTQAIAAILHHVGIPKRTTAVEDLIGLARGLNHMGVSHRARWRDGMWRVEQAAVCHEAAVKLLSWCSKPTGRAWSDYMLACFTTLTNLASAWVESTHASVSFGLPEADDRGFRRARTLLMAMREHQAYDRQVSVHDAMHSGRACVKSPSQSLDCVPDQMLNLQLKGASNYKSWDWILRNDLAEMNWRIGIHAINKRSESRWHPSTAKGPAAPRMCLQLGLEFHVLAINDLTAQIGQSGPAAAMQFWRWTHAHNLRFKLDAIEQLRHDGHHDWKVPRKLVTPQLLQQVDTILSETDEAVQLSTIDAYNERDYDITLWLGDSAHNE